MSKFVSTAELLRRRRQEEENAGGNGFRSTAELVGREENQRAAEAHRRYEEIQAERRAALEANRPRIPAREEQPIQSSPLSQPWARYRNTDPLSRFNAENNVRAYRRQAENYKAALDAAKVMNLPDNPTYKDITGAEKRMTQENDKAIKSGKDASRYQKALEMLKEYKKQYTLGENTSPEDRRAIYNEKKAALEKKKADLENRLPADATREEQFAYWLPRQEEKAKIEREIRQLEDEIKNYEKYYKPMDNAVSYRSDPDFEKLSKNLYPKQEDYINDTKKSTPAISGILDENISESGKRFADNSKAYSEYEKAKSKAVRDKLSIYKGEIPAEEGDDDIISEGNENGWQAITKSERENYYYLLNKYGEEKAYEYLDSIKPTLQKRATEFAQEEVRDTPMPSFLTSIAKAAGDVIAFSSDAIKTINGQEINPFDTAHYLKNLVDANRQGDAERVDEAFGGINVGGFSMGDVYNAGLSSVDMLTIPGLFGGAGKMSNAAYASIMSMGAAEETAKDLYDKGASNDQIIASSLASGAFEYIFEKVSLDLVVGDFIQGNFDKGKLAKALIVSAGVEGSEEVLTEAANYVADIVIMREKSERDQRIQSYIDAGYSEDKAKEKAGWDFANDLYKAGVGGALSIGFIGAGSAAASAASKVAEKSQQNQYTRAIGSAVNDAENIPALLKQAKESTDTDVQKKAAKLENLYKKYQSKAGTDEDSSTVKPSRKLTKTAGDLFNMLDEREFENARTPIDEMKAELGDKIAKATGARNDAAVSAIVKQEITRVPMTAEEEAAISSPAIQNVIKQNQELITNTDIAVRQAYQNINDTRSLLGGKEYDSFNVSDDGRDYIGNTPVKPQKVTAVTRDNMSIDVGTGEDAKATDISFADPQKATILKTMLDIQNSYSDDIAMTPEFVNAALKVWDDGKYESVNAFLHDVEGIYRAANTNAERYVPEVLSDEFADILTREAVASKNANISLKQQKIENAKTGTRKEGKVIFEAADGSQIVVNSSRDLKRNGIALNDLQATSIDTVTALSNATGITFRFFQSELKDGKYISKHISDSGQSLNGFYKDGEIYVDINAGAHGQGLILFTVSHELTHFMRDFAPEQFDKYAAYLFENYAKHGGSVRQAVYEEMNKHQKLTYDVAYEEVVARLSEAFLRDVHLTEKSRELYNTDKGLWQSIKTGLEKIVDRIEKYFAELSPDSRLGKIGAVMARENKDILDRFVAGIREAADNAAYTENTTDKGGVRMMAREENDFLDRAQLESKDLALKKQINKTYLTAIKRGDMQTARSMVEAAAKAAGFDNAIPEQTLTYSIRTEAAPKKTVKVYKVFTVADDGSPTALFVSGTEKLPQNVWLDAQDTWHFTGVNGLQYVPSTKNPYTKGGKTGGQQTIPNEEVRQELIKRGFISKGSKTKTVTALAYRPGWHAGDLPFFPQGGMQIAGSNYKNVHRYNQVVFECELDADKDYTSYHKNGEGKTVFHDMETMPKNGYYKFATNPMANSTDIGSWYISGSLKILRALTEEECNEILRNNGRPVQEWQQYQDKAEIKAVSKDKQALHKYEHTMGSLDLSKLGYTGERYDAARKTLAPITYDDNGDIIPLSERFNPDKPDDVRYDSRDDDYLSAVNRGDMETAQRMVDEAAKAAGYNTPKLYHGTQRFGFTEFDLNKMDDQRSIFLTSTEETASTYSGIKGTREISEKIDMDNIDDMSPKELVEVANRYTLNKREYRYYTKSEILEKQKEVKTALADLKKYAQEVDFKYWEKVVNDFDDNAEEISRAIHAMNEEIGKNNFVWIGSYLNNLINETDEFSTDKYKKLCDDLFVLGVVSKKGIVGDHIIITVKPETLYYWSVSDKDLRSRTKARMKYGNYATYAKLDNPLIIDADGSNWNNIQNWWGRFSTSDTTVEQDGKYLYLVNSVTGKRIKTGTLKRDVADVKLELHPSGKYWSYEINSDSPFSWREFRGNIEDAHKTLVKLANQYHESLRNTRDISEYAKENGYDGVVFRDLEDNGGKNDDVYSAQSDVYIVFDSSQVKSADPATYDDNGKVIPLSERFNTENKDIRYDEREGDLIDDDLLFSEYTDIGDVIKRQYTTHSEAIGEVLKNTADIDIAAGKVKNIVSRLLNARYTNFDVKTKQTLAIRLQAELENVKSADPEDIVNNMIDAVRNVIQDGMEKDPHIAELIDELKGAFSGRYYLTDDQINDLKEHNKTLNDFKKAMMGKATIVNKDTARHGIAGNINASPLSLEGVFDEIHAEEIFGITRDKWDTEGYHLPVMLMEAFEKLNDQLNVPLRDMTSADDMDYIATQIAAEFTAAVVQEKYNSRKNPYVRDLVNKFEARKKEAIKKRNEYYQGKMKELREQRDRKIDEQKTKTKEARQNATVQRKRAELKERIRKMHKSLRDMAMKPKVKKYIPSELLNQSIDVMAAVNLDSGSQGERADKFRQKLRDLSHTLLKLKSESGDAEIDAALSSMLDNLSDRVGNTPLGKMSLDQLKMVHDTLKAVQTNIRNRIEVIGAEKTRYIYDVAFKMIGEIDDAKVRKILGSKYVTTQLSPERFFNMICGGAKNNAGLEIYRMLDDGQLKQIELETRFARMFEGLVNDEKAKSLRSRTDKNLVDIGLVDEQGNKVKITRGMMLSLYMHLMNDDNIRHVMGGGLSVPFLKSYYTGKMDKAFGSKLVRVRDSTSTARDIAKQIEEKRGKINDDTSYEQKQKIWDEIEVLEQAYDAEVQRGIEEYINPMRTRIEKQLTDYDKEWIKTAKQFFDVESKNELNKTTMELYGFEKAVVKNYFPIHSDTAFTEQKFETIVRDMSLENMGMMKSRVGSANPIFLEDITDVINKQISNVAQYCGMVIPMTNVKRILNVKGSNSSTSVMATLRKYDGKAKSYIEKLLGDLVGANKGESSIIDKARHGLAGAALTMNFKVAIKQAASYPTAAAELGYIPLAKALVKGGKNNWALSRADKELIYKYSPLLAYRSMGYSNQELGDLKDSKGLVDKVMNSPKLKWAFGWIQAMDTATVGRLWYASQYYVDKESPDLKKGSDEYYREVARVFNNAVERTQPNYTVMQRPQLLRSTNAVTKMFTMFMTQRLQNFNIVYDAGITLSKMKSDFKNGKNGVTINDVKQAKSKMAHAVSSQLLAAGVLVGMTFLADALMHKMNPWRDDDDELTGESVGIRALMYLGESLAGSVWGGSEVFDAISSYLSGGTWYGISANGIDTLQDLTTNIYNFANKKNWKNAERLIKSLSQYAGIPYQNAKNIVEAVMLHAEDIQNGQFLSYEAGVNRTAKINAHRAWSAYNLGKYSDSKAIIKEMKDSAVQAQLDKGKNETQAKKDGYSSIRTTIRNLLRVEYLKARQNYYHGNQNEDDYKKIASITNFMTSAEVYEKPDVKKTLENWWSDAEKKAKENEMTMKEYLNTL